MFILSLSYLGIELKHWINFNAFDGSPLFFCLGEVLSLTLGGGCFKGLWLLIHMGVHTQMSQRNNEVFLVISNWWLQIRMFTTPGFWPYLFIISQCSLVLTCRVNEMPKFCCGSLLVTVGSLVSLFSPLTFSGHNIYRQAKYKRN